MTKKTKRKAALATVEAAVTTNAIALKSAGGTVHVPDEAMTVFERLARDPSVDPEKLERLIGMQERLTANKAKEAFDVAFAKMQREIPIMGKKNDVLMDGVKKYAFTSYADMQRVLRPILERHGFALRHRNESTDATNVKVIGILSHEGGHREEDEFFTLSDPSGRKNPVQALGSAREYGRRYTTIALLNIATEDQDSGHADDDGRASHPSTDDERRQSAPREQQQRSTNPNDTRPISSVGRDGTGTGQVGRLIAIALHANRTDAEIKAWLLARYGYKSKKQIQRRHYDEIIKAIEAPGALPAVEIEEQDREPGMEG